MLQPNGELSRLKTIEQLGHEGCTYGNVNRTRIENVENLYKSIDVKLWGLIALVAGRWVLEMLSQAPAVKAWFGQ